MRMLTLAAAARERWPSARVHVIANRNLPAAALARIPRELDVTLLATSPTLDDDGVIAVLDRCRPDLALFDNAGTARQCRHASRFGARTVFVSTRRETRARGLAADWLPWLDEHWVVEPVRLAEALDASEQRRVASARTVMRSFQSIFAPSRAMRRRRLQSELGCSDQQYVCFVPGGGGGAIGNTSAVAIFADAAAAVARTLAVRCVLLRGPLYQGPPLERPGVTIMETSHEQSVDLIEGARLVVLGASSTLFQALAQQKVCVATTSGGSEQLARAYAWAARGIIAAAEPEPDELAAAACRLLERRHEWQAVRARVVALGVTNDLPVALGALTGVLGRARYAAQ